MLTQMGINSPAYVSEFNKRTMTMRFSNGSEVLFSGLDDEMKLRSAEYSWIFVDEGSEVPDEIYQTLLGRLRYQEPRRLWVTTNPGASGWLRRNFVNATKPGFDHFRAPTTENHHLPQDYLDSLLTDYNDVWRERYDQEGDPGKRAIRGGSYAEPADRLRSAARAGAPVDYFDTKTGFRVLRELE